MNQPQAGKPTSSAEKVRRLYDALKCITLFDTPARMRKDSMKDSGLDFYEALEMAYENVLETAKAAIKGDESP